jgi:hypothetical protein
VTTTSTTGLDPAGMYSSNDIPAAAAGLPVTDGDPQVFRILARVVVPAQAGDRLDVSARAQVTNDCGYVVGVGAHIAYCSTENVAEVPLTRAAGGSFGDNVEPKRHHAPIFIPTEVIEVPPNWPAGHRMTVQFRANAHSTSVERRAGDAVTVEQSGRITVRRWTAPQPAEEPV